MTKLKDIKNDKSQSALIKINLLGRKILNLVVV